MWFASIWIFTLKLPWELGAALFMEHLLDADPASNILSWRWVAGLHTPGKHYLARAEDIHKYTCGQFNPVGQLNETADPLPMDDNFVPCAFPEAIELNGPQFPDLSCSPAGLVVCPEDLTPEVGELAEVPFSSICVFNSCQIMEATNVSAKGRLFINEAVQDSARRVAQHWSARIERVKGSLSVQAASASPDNVGCLEQPRVYSGLVDDWTDAVVTWASNENLKSVFLMQPPVGPWLDAMPSLRRALQARNIQLREYRRRWDARHWPHAGQGYFAFRKGLQERNTTLINSR